MTINKAAFDLIKEFEGFEPDAYFDPVNVLTIGYGTTAAADVGIVPKIGMRISEAEATEYLMRAVGKFEREIASAVIKPTTPNQWGAMVSLAYNIGPGAFRKSSVVRRFNAGDVQGAADAFMMWDKAGGKVLRGLVRRRDAERRLFLTPSTQPATAAHKQSINPPNGPQTAYGEPDNRFGDPRSDWLAALVAFLKSIFGGKA